MRVHFLLSWRRSRKNSCSSVESEGFPFSSSLVNASPCFWLFCCIVILDNTQTLPISFYYLAWFLSPLFSVISLDQIRSQEIQRFQMSALYLLSLHCFISQPVMMNNGINRIRQLFANVYKTFTMFYRRITKTVARLFILSEGSASW